mmetsp:Transcript_17409/g.40453  ORF Transcript_17409/g.40453 Transcript_17409/m.40453 type:complete len:312 (+) Transcript_17409:210-1145(+)
MHTTDWPWVSENNNNNNNNPIQMHVYFFGFLILYKDTNAVLYKGEWFRLVTGNLAFASMGECILGMMVLVPFSRRFEREMSSPKYSIFLLGVALWSMLLECIVAVVLGVPVRYSGPYPTLGALLGLYHVYCPRLYPRFFGILGFHFSEKSIAYALALQVLLYDRYASLLPALCGMAGGMAMTYPPFSTLDVPNVLVRFLSFLGGRFLFLSDPPPPMLLPRQRGGGRRPQPPPQDAPGGRGGGSGGGGGGGGFVVPSPTPPPAAAFPPPPPPPESVVEQLTSMGFERDAVLRALQASHNNVERAADRLLSGM